MTINVFLDLGCKSENAKENDFPERLVLEMQRNCPVAQLVAEESRVC